MASFRTLALLLAFGLMAGPAGGYTFDTIRGAPLSAGAATAVLALALLGAGSKAGIVPLHAWLPLAHPAAPSHVSALMSGVMTKVAVYGFVRIVFDLMGPPAWWWGAVVLLFGGASAVLGVLHALMEHDLKRLLAYHTVENIGIIFIGLGLSLAFPANATRELFAIRRTREGREWDPDFSGIGVSPHQRALRLAVLLTGQSAGSLWRALVLVRRRRYTGAREKLTQMHKSGNREYVAVVRPVQHALHSIEPHTNPCA